MQEKRDYSDLTLEDIEECIREYLEKNKDCKASVVEVVNLQDDKVRISSKGVMVIMPKEEWDNALKEEFNKQLNK